MKLLFKKTHSFVFCSLIMFTTALYTSAKITVLTYPVGQYSGSNWHHPAVTNSLLRGLKELQVNFNYNPTQESDMGETVVVLTNLDALTQAIRLKKTGKIKKLLVGPNLDTIFQPNYKLLASTEIDINLVPSNWVKTSYLEVDPSLINRICAWPAGVDTSFWRPTKKLSEKKTQQVIVYWKTESEEFCQAIERVLREYGWNPVRIKYGQYNQANYKQILEESLFAVFISRSESQGIALAEAWAMDAPTLVWNPQELTTYNRVFSEVSACPYLDPQNGLCWKTMQELKEILANLHHKLHEFTPRAWVMVNMSDAISSQKLLAIANSIKTY